MLLPIGCERGGLGCGGAVMLPPLKSSGLEESEMEDDVAHSGPAAEAAALCSKTVLWTCCEVARTVPTFGGRSCAVTSGLSWARASVLAQQVFLV